MGFIKSDEQKRAEFEAAWNKAYFPIQHPGGELRASDVYHMEETAGRFINPLASFALNRLNAWLNRPGGERWQGDERFSVSWRDIGPDAAECILTHVDSGAAWSVTWKPERGEATIVLAKRSEDGSDETLAEGEIDDGERVKRLAKRHFITTPSGPGAVYGYFSGDTYEKVFSLMQAISGSMPERFRMRTDDVVTGERQGYLEGQIGLLAFDGGLPGAACAAYIQTVLDMAFEPAANGVRESAKRFATQLVDEGAVWGKSVLSYHGGDMVVCSIGMPDGSPAFFHVNKAKWKGDVGYVSWFENYETEGARLCVQMFKADEDCEAMVDAVVSGNGDPVLVYDYKQRASVSGRASWTSRELFFFDYAIDLDRAVEEGVPDDEVPWKCGSLPNAPGNAI